MGPSLGCTAPLFSSGGAAALPADGCCACVRPYLHDNENAATMTRILTPPSITLVTPAPCYRGAGVSTALHHPLPQAAASCRLQDILTTFEVSLCLIYLLKEPTSAEPSRKAFSAVLPLSSRFRCTSGRRSMLSLLEAAP
jgi:hypothetical protein